MSAPTSDLTVTAADTALAVTFEPNTRVACRPGESLLLAGLRAGLPLSYECASGGCGSCRAVLVDGSVTSRWLDANGLSERDRRRGNRILLCQSRPESPCTVRAVTVSDSDAEPTPRRREGRLHTWQLLTADTARVVVETDSDLAYLPGQFVIVEFADGTRRAYSMSRPFDPIDPNSVELLIRAKPGGAASGILFDGPPRDLPLVVEGPYGRAYSRPDSADPVVCLAGGTGLAPILAITEDLVGRGRDVQLYVGARRAEDLVLAERVATMRESGAGVVLAVEHAGVARHPTLGPLRHGLALEHLAADIPDLSGHDVYLAGPAPMIDASLQRLVRSGTARADRLFFDRFLA